MKKETEAFNLCPGCFKQGKRICMEADKGSDVAKCSVHGVISLKYFNDIFINPVQWTIATEAGCCVKIGETRNAVI